MNRCRYSRAAEAHGLEVVALEDVEHLERGDALAVRRQLPHVVAAVVGRDRLDPLGVVRGQVRGGEIAAVGAHVLLDALGDLALVEGVAAALGDGARACWPAADSGRSRPWPARGRRACRSRRSSGYFASRRGIARPALGDDLASPESRRARSEIAGCSSSFIGSLPNLACSSNQPSTRAGHRHAAAARAAGSCSSPCFCSSSRSFASVSDLRRPAAGVEAVELLRLRIPDDGEQVAADALPRGLHEAQDGVGRDGGVDRGAAALEDVERHLARQRLAGRRHAVRGDDFRARGDQRAAGTRAGVRPFHCHDEDQPKDRARGTAQAGFCARDRPDSNTCRTSPLVTRSWNRP